MYLSKPVGFILTLLVILAASPLGIGQSIPLFGSAANPNQYKGTDSQRIQKAVAAAKKKGGVVVIPSQNSNGSDRWLLDEAILLPSDITVVLENCTIQLSDSCRDNMFRSDNVGVGIENPGWNRNISLVGIGKVVLKGASNPRSTGDGARQLTLDPDAERKKGNWRVSYGTDAGRKDRKQTGDWRNIMILMAYVDGFSMKNLRIENSHAWAVSFERAHNVDINDIEIYNPEEIEINGRQVKVFNKDGIDLRQGCKNFRISNVRGFTADDFIALSSLNSRPALERKSGSLESTMISRGGWHGPEDDTEQIYISNIQCESICRAVAIRASDSASIHHVYITGLVSREATGVGGRHNALLLGGKGYGTLNEPGKINNIFLQNVVTDGHSAVMIEAPIANCHFMNVMYSGKNSEVVHYAIEKETVRNVTQTNMVKVGE